MVGCALAWGWWRVAVLLLTGFFGLLRPSEYLFLRASDFFLPTAHLAGQTVFVAVQAAKTRFRAARKQYVKIDVPAVVNFIEKCLQTCDPP